MLSRGGNRLQQACRLLGGARGFASASAAKPEGFNIPPSVQEKIGRNLHRMENHPIRIVKDRVHDYFAQKYRLADGTPEFKTFDQLDPRVTTQQCFDDLLIPADHVSRQPSDTFYFDRQSLLRTHTSAHQTQFLRAGHEAFLATGDCYRRDTIDRYHFPIFHQMEGVRLFPNPNPGQRPDAQATEMVLEDLRGALGGLVDHLFGEVEKRWSPDYFPFTDPSLELEILYNGQWMEILGSGVVQQQILNNCGREDRIGWAYGIGLERIAMALFDIPDIRLFWTEDPRFLDQFKDGAEGVKFKPFSKHPSVYKDLSIWLGPNFHENDLAALIREYGGDDLVEEIQVIDQFVHPKTQRESRCYRITYRSVSRTLTNEEIDALQEQVRREAPKQLDLELR